jgi:hypothetical protein
MSKIYHVSKLRTSSKMAGVAMDEDQLKQLAQSPEAMRRIGVSMDSAFAKTALSVAMDAGLTQPITTSSAGVPVQFLQNFLQGVVHILTTARRGDVLAPVMTVGDWSDEEIVLTILEHLGQPELYKDHGDLPIAAWNSTYERRTIVRFELGAESTKLDEERSAKVGVNSMDEKRAAVALAFEILRNEIFFYGFNNGANRTYGFLNDPNLPAFVTLPNGAAADNTWASKTVAERVTDIVTAIGTLRTQSGSQVDPESMRLKLAVAADIKDLMNESDSSFSNGMTVNEWMQKNYPNITVESIPEFDAADGGENVFYLYAENVDGSGTDGGETVIQAVPTKMTALNTVQTARGVREGYTNATAGCFVKRGYAVVRYSGA